MNTQPKHNQQLAMRAGRMQGGKLSPARRATTIMLALVQVGLLVAALIDLRQRPAAQVRGNKRFWTLIVFINWVGPISYFLFGRVHPKV